MVRYTLYSTQVVKFDGTYTTVIPVNNGTAAWVEYQEWLAAGNQPELPEEPPVDDQPTMVERIEATETLINLILDEDAV